MKRSFEWYAFHNKLKETLLIYNPKIYRIDVIYRFFFSLDKTIMKPCWLIKTKKTTILYSMYLLKTKVISSCYWFIDIV
jgi:hypothetical protein